MFHVTGCEPVVGLTRSELWAGLVGKASDPVPFVPAITACRVLEEEPGGLVREVVVRGSVVRERVAFEPETAVRFERLSGPVSGRIENRIEEGPDGSLALRFTFDLEVDRIEPGSDEERAWADRMADSYLEAVRSTLAETRRRLGAEATP